MPADRSRTDQNQIINKPHVYCGLFATGFGVLAGGLEVGLVDAAGFCDGMGAGVFSGTLGFGCAVGRGVLVKTGLFDTGSEVASGTESAIVPLVQISARLSLLISNSITLRFGSRGSAGRFICFPLIESWTKLASDFE